ncbi:hypothetical protein CcrC1_gp470 [Caulobacter phage C1]|nr:hypothetical protein CcrC1_gp470 [Caulobacter phage C1]UTU08680.1 hypothetical protein CcrC2_gp452 [Caulobacter phage C2]WGN97346.1 hypothetical protein [Bertelyvirus sp.]WGN97884.1 hypothetical protein [Bertelyvirus sp.]
MPSRRDLIIGALALAAASALPAITLASTPIEHRAEKVLAKAAHAGGVLPFDEPMDADVRLWLQQQDLMRERYRGSDGHQDLGLTQAGLVVGHLSLANALHPQAGELLSRLLAAAPNPYSILILRGSDVYDRNDMLTPAAADGTLPHHFIHAGTDPSNWAINSLMLGQLRPVGYVSNLRDPQGSGHLMLERTPLMLKHWTHNPDLGKGYRYRPVTIWD